MTRSNACDMFAYSISLHKYVRPTNIQVGAAYDIINHAVNAICVIWRRACPSALKVLTDVKYFQKNSRPILGHLYHTFRASI